MKLFFFNNNLENKLFIVKTNIFLNLYNTTEKWIWTMYSITLFIKVKSYNHVYYWKSCEENLITIFIIIIINCSINLMLWDDIYIEEY